MLAPKLTLGIGQVAVVREIINGYQNYPTLEDLENSGAPVNTEIIARVTNDVGNPAANGNYEWNGGIWVKSAYDPLNQANAYTDNAVADEAQARQQADQDEAQARQDADALETQARQDADQAEAQARQQADQDEAQARQDADQAEAQARQDAIASEVQARQQADQDEAQARQQADQAEAQARQDADALETQARQDADQAEAQARQDADQQLGTLVQQLTDKILGKLGFNNYHDDQGNRYLFAIVNRATNRLLFGISNKLKIQIGDTQIIQQQIYGIRDKAGQYALAVTPSGKVYIPRLVLPSSLTTALEALTTGLAAEIATRTATDNGLQAQQTTLGTAVNLLNSQFAFQSKIHDDNGTSYSFAVVHRATGKIAFGISKKGRLVINRGMLAGSGYPFHIQDLGGQTAVLVKRNGTVLIPKLQLNSYQLGQIPVNNQLSLQMRNFVPAQINHHIGDGQSLSIGTATAMALSVTQPYSNLTFASGPTKAIGDSGYNPTLIPLVESNSVESPTSGILNGFVRRIVETGGVATDYPMLGTASGVGGQRVSALTDETLFTRLRQHVTDAKAAATAQGKTYGVSSISWIQGEADITGSLWTRAIDYYQRYLALMTKIRQVAIDASGQSYLPTIYSYQTAAHSYYQKRYLGIAIAQWRASVEHPDICLATPAYRLPHTTDNLHLTAEGSWLLGEYIGRAMYWTMVKGQKWRPLEPISVSWNGSHIDVKFHVPCKPIQLSTLICSQAVNQGFDIWTNGSVYDSGATSNDDQLLSTAIQNVTILDEETVRIHLNNAVTIPDNAVLSYGRGRAGDPAVAGPAAGARGNIMDSHGLFDVATSPLGTVLPLYNVSVYFEYSRQNGFF